MTGMWVGGDCGRPTPGGLCTRPAGHEGAHVPSYDGNLQPMVDPYKQVPHPPAEGAMPLIALAERARPEGGSMAKGVLWAAPMAFVFWLVVFWLLHLAGWLP